MARDANVPMKEYSGPEKKAEVGIVIGSGDALVENGMRMIGIEVVVVTSFQKRNRTGIHPHSVDLQPHWTSHNPNLNKMQEA